MGMKTKRYEGIDAIAIAFNPEQEWWLHEIRVHLSAADGATENLVIKMDSEISEKYDYVLDTEAFSALADYQYLPTRPMHFVTGDGLDISLANANNRTWGLEIIYE